MTTIKLDDSKYEFDIDDTTGLMIAVRRHGEAWPAGFESQFNKSFMSALWRIRDLEAAARDDGMCKSCVDEKCVTGPECVTLGRDAK